MLSLPMISWSTLATLITIATFYVLINYEVQRWKDKQRQREGIYIRRVTRLEALIVIFTPALPILMAAVYILEPGTEGVTLGIVGLLASAIFVAYLRYVHVAYVKISPEGIEQRMWSARTTVYPFNAIDGIEYYEATSTDDQDLVSFYSKSGKLIAAFCPIIHKNYRLMAIVRFRVDNDRWPDMNNPSDIARVDALDNGPGTVPYFREREKVTGLADVDM